MQPGVVATPKATGMSAVEKLLQAKMANSIALPTGAGTTDNVVDRVVIGQLMRLGLSLATLPRDSLYQLQDSVTKELCARDGHTGQVLSEQ